MLEFKTEELGNMYLKEGKISLLACNQYTFVKDNKIIATFFTGKFHSGVKYYSIKSEIGTYSLKLISSNLLRKVYGIYNSADNGIIGSIKVNHWKMINNTSDSLMINDVIYNCQPHSGILSRLWNSNCFLKIYNTESEILYSGIIKAGNLGKIDFIGKAEITGDSNLLDVVMGLFWVDIMFRKWVRRNID